MGIAQVSIDQFVRLISHDIYWKEDVQNFPLYIVIIKTIQKLSKM